MDKIENHRHQIHLFYSNYPNNHFDSVAQRVIKQVENSLDKLSQRREQDLKKDYMTEMQVYFLQNELMALSKMKLIYMYMNFEIHIKKLISIAYNEVENDLYNWEKVISFFKSKDIEIKKLENYSDVNDIRNLSNSIKHSEGLINERTRNIDEFKGRKTADVDILNKFYERTMDSPKELIGKLTKEINKDLYEFSEARLDSITRDFNMRMDDNTKEKFIIRLRND